MSQLLILIVFLLVPKHKNTFLISQLLSAILPYVLQFSGGVPTTQSCIKAVLLVLKRQLLNVNDELIEELKKPTLGLSVVTKVQLLKVTEPLI